MKKLLRNLKYGEPVVVISGLPRSGTSMAMKMLDAGGLELVVDDHRLADEDNPKGYYEDERVKDLADTDDRSWVKDARGKGIKVISFLLKDLPKEHFYKVVFMSRDLEEVLASQQKMLDRRGEDNEIEDQQMRDLWENHLWRVRYMLKHEKNYDWIDVPYREALADPATAARRIAEFVGGLDAEKMTAVVDPTLYRNRAEAAS